jgi:hypothetical protein
LIAKLTYCGPPMTHDNMRANGVRDLQVHCADRNCHHQVTISVDDFADALVVIGFGPRIVCTASGMIGADVRLNWRARTML